MKGSDLFEYRKKYGLTQAALADVLNITRQTLVRYEQSEALPSSKLPYIKTKLKAYSSTHKSLKEDEAADYETTTVVDNSVNEPNTLYKGVPYYNIDFTASFLPIENNQQITPDNYIKHPFFNGCDYVVRASGQSMAKVIKNGDAIGLLQIKNWQDFLQMGEIYAIVTNNGFRMIKVITKAKNADSFLLLSKPTDNKKEDFPPQEIKKIHIKNIYKVQVSMSLL